MTGPTPAVVAAVMELEGCSLAPRRVMRAQVCSKHRAFWDVNSEWPGGAQCAYARHLAAAAENAALRAAASDPIPRAALANGTRDWLRDRAARVGGES